MYVRELHVRYQLRWVADDKPPPAGPITQPVASVPILRSVLAEEAVEVCGLLCLSTTRRLLAYHCVSRGALDHTIVRPHEVFKVALLCNASGIIIGHNHPSGDCLPSSADVLITKRLVAAGELMGISVLDHIIVTVDGSYWSFHEHGRL